MAEHILLLGGTGLAIPLAHRLIEQDYQLTYSIAGLVRQPDLTCRVISGGFSQLGGMATYIRAEGISRVVDATHPYATQISHHAMQATKQCDIPYWRLQRPPWPKCDTDNWLEFPDWTQLLPALQTYQTVFLSHGRLSAEHLEQLAAIRQQGQRFYLRTAIPPTIALPSWLHSITAIWLFTYQDELSLFSRLGVDLLVSKNSGGEMTYAKIQAARQLKIPVLMLQRPALTGAGITTFQQTDDVLAALSVPTTP